MTAKFRNIETLVPQRYPFIMVDCLKTVSAELFESEFLIKSENIFVDDGFFQVFGMIENIAQTATAGLNISINQGSAVEAEGFIGSVAKLTVFELPKVEEVINTRILPLVQLNNMFKLKGECYLSDNMLMECEISLVAG